MSEKGYQLPPTAELSNIAESIDDLIFKTTFMQSNDKQNKIFLKREKGFIIFENVRTLFDCLEQYRQGQVPSAQANKGRIPAYYIGIHWKTPISGWLGQDRPTSFGKIRTATSHSDQGICQLVQAV